ALAQQIDGAASTDAQDIAKLIFLSSLSTATNPVLGLSRSEILGDLAAPERDVVKLRGVFWPPKLIYIDRRNRIVLGYWGKRSRYPVVAPDEKIDLQSER
ncbi:MAG: hypothetical protein V1758_11035, partial [Pseudomonadota bacterium]